MKFLSLPLLGLLLQAAACGSSESDSDVDNNDDFSAPEECRGNLCEEPPVVPTCVAGNSCECANDSRLEGVVACDGDVASCDCDACTPLEEPSEGDAPFSACGGEPFGLWKSTSTDWSNYVLPGGCEIWEPQELEPNDNRIDILDGGDARFALTGLRLRFKALSSCLGNCTRVSASVGELDCVDDGCGVCSCEMSHGAIDYNGSWTRDDTTLSFYFEGFSSTYDVLYCVENGGLRYEDPDGRLITLEPAEFVGEPLGCDDRGEQDCELGGGCRLGDCLGTGDCTAANSETACLTRQNCEWDPSDCAGVAASTCELSDYGNTPGCESVTEDTRCVGTAIACGDLPDGECDTNPTCFEDPDCLGEATPCWALAFDLCNSVPGCSITHDADPAGDPPSPAGQAGVACAVDEQCASGKCCDGNCSASSLECTGRRCTSNSECYGGFCVGTLEDGGFCTIDCSAGSDICPRGTVCTTFVSGNERCYPECSVDAECKEAYGETFICHSSDICLVE